MSGDLIHIENKKLESTLNFYRGLKEIQKRRLYFLNQNRFTKTEQLLMLENLPREGNSLLSADLQGEKIIRCAKNYSSDKYFPVHAITTYPKGTLVSFPFPESDPDIVRGDYMKIDLDPQDALIYSQCTSIYDHNYKIYNGELLSCLKRFNWYRGTIIEIVCSLVTTI